MHERQVRLVEEVIDQHRRVGLHPQHGQPDRGDTFSLQRHARHQLRQRSPRRPRSQPHQAIPLSDLRRPLQGSPRRDLRLVAQRRDVHAPAIRPEPPPVIRALERAAGDRPGRQPRPPVRASVGERRRPRSSSPRRASAQPWPASRTATGSEPTSQDRATGCQNSASAGCALVNSSAVMSLSSPTPRPAETPPAPAPAYELTFHEVPFQRRISDVTSPV